MLHILSSSAFPRRYSIVDGNLHGIYLQYRLKKGRKRGKEKNHYKSFDRTQSGLQTNNCHAEYLKVCLILLGGNSIKSKRKHFQSVTHLHKCLKGQCLISVSILLLNFCFSFTFIFACLNPNSWQIETKTISRITFYYVNVWIGQLHAISLLLSYLFRMMVDLQIHFQCAAARASHIDNRLKRLEYKEMGIRHPNNQKEERRKKNGEEQRKLFNCKFLWFFQWLRLYVCV